MYLFLKWLRVVLILLFVLGVCRTLLESLFAVTEGLKKKFDENEITIPFPQRDVSFDHGLNKLCDPRFRSPRSWAFFSPKVRD